MYIQGAWEGLMRASDPQELKIKVGCELAAVGAGNWTRLLQEQWALTTHQPFLQPHTQIPSADTNILSAPWGLLSCECITTLTEVLSTVALLWSPLDPEAPSSRAWWTCLCDWWGPWQFTSADSQVKLLSPIYCISTISKERRAKDLTKDQFILRILLYCDSKIILF